MGTQSEEQNQPSVSVVIPVFNGGSDLEKCLAAIDASAYPVFECILVDDASTDGMVEPAAERHSARVIRLERQSGPAKARNKGVAEARGDVIVFTDADVLLHPEAISRAVAALQSEPKLGAVIGSYDDQPAHQSFISQYRNLFHHWVHQSSAEEATTFWTGCGAIRRDVFIQMGGFNPDYHRPSIEDIELGTRLRKSGYGIRLVKNMRGKHMKQWRFWNTIKTDIFFRGVPWMLLILRDGQITRDLNLNYKSRLATVIASLLGLTLLVLTLAGHAAILLPLVAFLTVTMICAGAYTSANKNPGVRLVMPLLAVLAPMICYWLFPDSLALIPLALLVIMLLTHLTFYRFVIQKRNLTFAIAVVPMQVIFFLCCAISIPLAYIQHYRASRDVPTVQNETDKPG